MLILKVVKGNWLTETMRILSTKYPVRYSENADGRISSSVHQDAHGAADEQAELSAEFRYEARYRDGGNLFKNPILKARRNITRTSRSQDGRHRTQMECPLWSNGTLFVKL